VTLGELNALDRGSFAARLGGVAEGSPWVAEGAWARRPFPDLDALADAFRRAIMEAPTERQVELIRAHPDLAGRAAVAGALTPASAAEQASAGLDRLDPATHAALTALTAAYRARFGFPFVVAVRGRTVGEILAAAETRLANAPEAELNAALEEIARIVRLRLEAYADL
jgi:OHCU decarboxylase